MTGSQDAQSLGALLLKLKRRGGVSYAQLARRTYTSSSTLHRYCTGTSVPPDYDVVVRLARECGATPAELNKLLRLWTAATEDAQRADPLASDGSHGDAPPMGASPSTAPLPETLRPQSPSENPRAAEPLPVSPLVRSSAARPRRLPGPAVLLALLLGVLVFVLAPNSGLPASSQPPAPPRAPGSSGSPGDQWTDTPHLVPETTFGVTINSSSGVMPSFRVGSVRLWDSGTRWANIQPRRGEFRWSTLDRLVDGAEQAGRPVLFVLGGTPAWAAPKGPKSVYADGSRTAPPDDLADWDAFVRALGERYRDRIEAYELWVMANDRRFYSGSVETLVEMTERADRILKDAAPEATVVCPGMGRLWERDALPFLRRFAKLGGYDHCDVAGIKLHQRHASDPPETMAKVLTAVDETLHRVGVHPPLWSTGTTYDLPLQGSLSPERARDYAVRFFLVGLYGREVNLRRMYFYNWGSGHIPIVLQAEGAPPTKAARAVEQLQRWLAGARIHGCGHGAAEGLPDKVWQCGFSGGPHGPGGRAVIRWAESGTATTMVGSRGRSVHALDGTVVPVQVGDEVEITEEPVLISSRRVPVGD
ncbi:helix-turn-helix domain-containing protein [Streptomyces sp. KR80]|uniref:helix-turn-helix domain-containing protein n=1 Tax=Streptomyces sp. KR80 TaxID=3457426 RepID=UPI003FD55426